MEIFERRQVSLVSITQPLNTTGSLGRLTLNILLSFAEFERQMIADRTRDKMAAARRKGKWVGGTPVLGYDLAEAGGKLVVNHEEARRVQAIFTLYLQHRSVAAALVEIQARNWTTKRWRTRNGKDTGGQRSQDEADRPGRAVDALSGRRSAARTAGRNDREEHRVEHREAAGLDEDERHGEARVADERVEDAGDRRGQPAHDQVRKDAAAVGSTAEGR